MKLPFFFEYSKIPQWLSYFAPISIWAITIGPFVFSRGKMSEVVMRHETIHWRQYVETGVVFFPLLYLLFYIRGYIKYGDGRKAYVTIPFEQEAYLYEHDPYYLHERKLWAWAEFRS